MTILQAEDYTSQSGKGCSDEHASHRQQRIIIIENGQANQSAMERPYSGGAAYVITVSPVHTR